jgi:hypothetical protein
MLLGLHLSAVLAYESAFAYFQYATFASLVKFKVAHYPKVPPVELSRAAGSLIS